MMYPFMTLDDQTEIVHSEMREDGSVKVYMERPDQKDCFHYVNSHYSNAQQSHECNYLKPSLTTFIQLYFA